MANFQPLLAGTINSTEELDSLIYPVVGSPKIDGIRTIAQCGKLYTRSMKLIRNKYLQDFYAKFYELDYNGYFGYDFDGELTVGAPGEERALDVFQRTTTAVMGEHNEMQCTYWVFDDLRAMQDDYIVRLEHANLRLSGLNADIADGALHVNPEDLTVSGFGPPEHHPIIFRMLPYKLLYNKQAVLEYEEECVRKGFEGIMLRNPERKYKCGRSSINPKQQHLLKLKRFADAEALVVGYEELMHNNNAATLDNFGCMERSGHKENLSGGGVLGALKVIGLNGEFDGVEFRIGTGFDAATRSSLWALKDTLHGKTITYKYQACGVKDAPRFPVFKGFRGAE